MCERQNGPDWTDILSTLKSLEETHKCAVVIHLWPATARVGGGLLVTVSVHQPEGMIERFTDGPAVWDNFPNRTSRTMEGLLTRLLLELDYKCSKEIWSQKELPLLEE